MNSTEFKSGTDKIKIETEAKGKSIFDDDRFTKNK